MTFQIKLLIDPKPLQIIFFKTDGFIRIYDGTRCLTLFGSEKFDAVYGRITYFMSQKVASHIFFWLFCKNQSWFLCVFAYRENIHFE